MITLSQQPLPRLWQRLCLALLATSLVGSATPRAETGRTKLDLKMVQEGQTVKVTVPEGVVSVTLQKFRRQDGWTMVDVKKAVPGVMRFNLPNAKENSRWRAIGRVELKTASRDKFPAAFYQGKKEFRPTKSAAKGILGPAVLDRTAFEGGVAGIPVESDIWKVDGKTVYFFNQLRGLQVLDLSDPTDPRITASLRLPAEGQELYLLPGDGSVRNLVLLTGGWSDDGGEWTRINVVKVSGGTAEITSTRIVPGYLADSRMVGNRLILATTEWNYTADDGTDGWDSRSNLSEWLISPDSAPQAAGKTVIEGDSPIIASGPDWLALAVHPRGRWDVSDISVFAIRRSGLVQMGAPFRTEGSVASKFGMQWSDNVLTTISEHNVSANGWSPTTVLENFRAWSPEIAQVIRTIEIKGPIGRLALAKGESLFATRFSGNKAYIVTFLQKDPLFVVDLSDPVDPKIAGQIEVPGWSTHLEPLGDLLFAVGWEENSVVASLFDVANPANPQLLRRLSLGAPGTYSQALWDEKALKLLPDAGLAMIPLSTYNRNWEDSTSIVQLIDVDTKARDLRLRGLIAHEFDALRADLVGKSVVSISQRVMVAADISDRDAPSILSEVSLAWPVDRVLESGDYLIQIEDGSWYGGGRATARISPAKATEAILAETDLGKGTVKAADLRDGKLYVLREISPSYPFFYMRSVVMDTVPADRMILDIYDATALPALGLIGSRTVIQPDGGRVGIDHLLWPQSNRPAIVVSFGYSFGFWHGPILLDRVSTSLVEAATPVRQKSFVMIGTRPYWASSKSPRLVVFDTTVSEDPADEDSVTLGSEGSTFSGVAEAADGLIVMGNSQSKEASSDTWFDYGVRLQSVHVIEVPETGPPIVRPVIDLPGELFAVTELDRDGFLAFTRTYSDDGTSTAFEVSACDGYDAFSITSLDAPGYAVAAAGGRRLFVVNEGGVERHTLTEAGVFSTDTPLDIGWTAYSLRVKDGFLIGSQWNALFAAKVFADEVTRWEFATWNPGVDQVVPAANGDLLVPFGDYGVERLQR